MSNADMKKSKSKKGVKKVKKKPAKTSAKTSRKLEKDDLWYYAKIGTFFAIVYLIVPLFLELIAVSQGGEPKFTIAHTKLHILLFVMLLVFFVLTKDDIIKIPVRKRTAETVVFSLAALPFFVSFFVYRYLVKTLYANIWHIAIVSSIFYVIGSVFLFMAFFGLNFTTELVKKYKKTFIAMAALVFIYSLVRNWLNSWAYLAASFVAWLSAWFGSFFFSTYYSFANVPFVRIGSFGANIVGDCSGIESSSLFLFLFFVVLLYDSGIKKDWRFFSLGILGFFGAYVMTSLRVFLLMAVGNFNKEFAITLFHNNIGWVLFVIYVFFFYWLVLKVCKR